MKQLFLIITMLFSILTKASGQEPGKITGMVIDADLEEPLYATGTLNDAEGNLLKGVTTTEDGRFKIENIAYENYQLSIQFIGYKTFTENLQISATNRTLALGNIALQPEVSQ